VTVTVLEVLKESARPTSVTFFLAVIAFGLVLAFVRRTQRLARWYFAALFATCWIVASPACAERLVEWRGRGYRPLATAADARGATVVVVLGAGNQTIHAGGLTINRISTSAALRILEGARLYRLLDRPTIIVSGGVTGRDPGSRPEAEAMRTALLQLGVAAEHVVLEAESKNTREEAVLIARMLADRPPQPIVLVTSPVHMSRSLAAFRAAGLDPVPAVAAYKSDHSLERHRWIPSDGGLILIDTVVYESAADVYYWALGLVGR
jgi:uncharacterized SAM-binding protein YcdF (DUF218 family)